MFGAVGFVSVIFSKKPSFSRACFPSFRQKFYWHLNAGQMFGAVAFVTVISSSK
jgi:hypothetical protein